MTLSNVKTHPGKDIDRMRERIQQRLNNARAESERLQQLGAESLNGPHYKTGTRKMFFNRPTDTDGRRQQVYVGTDADKQAAYLSRQRRAQRREHLTQSAKAIVSRFDEAITELNRAHMAMNAALRFAESELDGLIDPDDTLEIEADHDASACPRCGHARRDRLRLPGREIVACTGCDHIEDNHR